MHPYFVASILVGSVAVAYGAYLIYKEMSEDAFHVYNSNERAYARGCKGDEEEESVVGSEKQGLRRRKKSNAQSIEEDEQDLLDKYSYLNALEQEIERKKQVLADEERILSEKEQEIQNRKQYLQSVSSRSSSNTDLSPLVSQRKASIASSNTSTSEIITNDLHDQPVLIQGEFPVTQDPPKSVISIQTVSSVEENRPINKSSDAAAQSILSQHLSKISHRQQSLSDLFPSTIIQNSDSAANLTKINPSSRSERNVYQLDNPPYAAKSIASEETWSEIDSVLSENIESVMSSALDIDMDEVDVIEH
ncbi:2166_t:CDS:2 [Funneliformis geosporum]|uniref:872_t:CDS:1 n=1 Tax=Funneliformis geosporum TaxID=1117311 RepID=A0A9W4WLL7_9GLOM|nr:2166_t:CDS:2 [Funneliformis geosporum]CAI2170647.1 872_t:CDS:2 [Funneliformis geosporum]